MSVSVLVPLLRKFFVSNVIVSFGMKAMGADIFFKSIDLIGKCIKFNRGKMEVETPNFKFG